MLMYFYQLFIKHDYFNFVCVLGQQTLAVNLLWLLLYLAKHQDCQEKIYRELRNNTVGPEDFVHIENKDMFPYTSESKSQLLHPFRQAPKNTTNVIHLTCP